MAVVPLPVPRIAVILCRLALALACGPALRGVAGEGAAFRPVHVPGMENTFAVGSRLYSGSQPEGEAAFAALAALGVRTVISVDGAAPDAAAAERHGLRYVHLPIGYDGIARTNQLRLAKAVASAKGPVYFHCHHGRHRGPAAVAVVCEAVEGWTPEAAQAWMRTAGTATNYPGLYRAVAGFRRPTPAELAAVPAEFASRAPTPALVDAMVRADDRMDSLKAVRAAGYRVPADQPDLVPSGEALQLLELFREARRTGLGSEKGGRYGEELLGAEQAAEGLLGALKRLESGRTAAAEAEVESRFQAVSRSCTACHKAVRDPGPGPSPR